MKRLIILSIAFSVLIGFVFYTIPQTEEEEKKSKPQASEISSDPELDKILEDYEAYLYESLKQTGTPGASVAIIKDTSIIYLKGFGVKEVGTKEPVDVHSVFRLASVSKSLTATLIGILVADGVFSWDDPVVKYLPEFKLKSEDQTKALTLRHLLSHTTGLPYHAYTNLIEEGDSLVAMMRLLKDVDMIGDVGKVYSYQNVAFSIIGEVVKAATNKSFEDEMNERLFGPLHMTDASMDYESITYNDNVAHPHLMRNHNWTEIAISHSYYNTSPAGGINASITDMAKWLIAVLGNKEEVISSETLDTLFEPSIRAIAKNRNFNQWSRIQKSYYGLGWRIINFKNDTIAYHGGYVNGYRSEVAVHPTKKIAICILANGPSRFAGQAIPAFLKLYDKYKAPKIVSAAH